MSVLEKLMSWLQTFPQWDDGVRIDGLEPVPGSLGLFPQGVQELGSREDILGNVQVDNRLTVVLYRITAGEDDRAEDAAWLLALQDWVQQQSLAGLTPRLGDVPHRQRIRAERGRLKEPSQTGAGRYAVTITAEYAVIVDNYDEL